MARLESKMIMGYLPIEPHHHPAITSLVLPATPAVKLLDPFAGDGLFLEVAAKAWNVIPYANELDGERAQACIERFGPKQAVRCDVERLLASNNAFGVAWLNPPYDHDKTAKANKRVEFAYLRHSWKWLQEGGLALWCIYNQHITEDAAVFLAKNSRQVDVWALPGKHQGEYDQVIVAAIKGTDPNTIELYQRILEGKANPRPLTVQSEPLYKLPAPPHITRFIFAPDIVDEKQGLRLIQEQGAWKTHGFQALLEIPRSPEQIEPVVAPRPGHMALVLAAGVANGAVIQTEDYGQVAIRGKTQQVEQIARVEIEAVPDDPTQQIKKTTIRLKPTTILTLLAQNGTVVEMEGDEALLGFITANKPALTSYLNQKFKPMYAFDLAGIGHWLDRIRLKGKYPMYTAQKHVVGATVRGFQSRNSILLVGSMGTGKTLMGGSTAISMAAGVVEQLRGQIADDQVVLIVAPPHLVEKWKRELHSISRNIYVERLDRHEDVKAFMDKAARLGAGIAKIGLIKRDMTKLGAGREVGVVWREEWIALWRHGQPAPEGYESQQRLMKQRVPQCPTCGRTVLQERKGTLSPASESWLKSGKRRCQVCQTPLWQEARDKSSQPKPGQKYPTKNPRYRLDEYLKRVYPERVYLLIWDEAHECAHGDTGNGEAFNRLAGLAQKVLAMTGTPFNGRSSSIFNLEYALNPRTRQRYNWGGAPRLSRKTRSAHGFQTIVADDSKQRGHAESRWVADMGVREQVIEERPSYDKETGAFTGTSTYEKPYEEAPGISPLLVAEVLDHAIFFSLGDLGKALPQYEEIALPVTMDPDCYEQYDRTRQQLKDYLIARRWEGDTTFRGSYLQWAMGWMNAAHRPHEVIHNMKHPITGEKLPHVVANIPSYGEERVYAKEQALIDLVRSELEQNRPCVIYLRQTSTRDIQPRIEALIRQHVPLARPYILKNTVDAERREAVIESEVAKGTNVVIANPELVKTGLDLVFAPSLIFYEITFNLGTMMQAAGRSYRLNQTHTHCKTYYLFAEGTMEQTAVQLMSRKQRAAKLLTGDIGLTGLDALTEGEGGFEAALLDALGRDESLLDPAKLFKKSVAQDETDSEDAAYWNVVAPTSDLPAHPALPVPAAALTLTPPPTQRVALPASTALSAKLATLNLPTAKLAKVQARIQLALEQSIPHLTDSALKLSEGVGQPDLMEDAVHAEVLTRWLAKYLRSEKALNADEAPSFAAELVALVQPTPALPMSDPFAAAAHRVTPTPARAIPLSPPATVSTKLATLNLPTAKLAKVQARIIVAIEQGIPHPTDSALKLCEGINHPDFAKYPVHAEVLIRWLAKYLRSEKALNANEAPPFAAELVALARPPMITAPPLKLTPPKSVPKLKKAKPDLLAIPADTSAKPAVKGAAKPTPQAPSKSASRPATRPTPQQRPLFDLPPVAYA